MTEDDDGIVYFSQPPDAAVAESYSVTGNEEPEARSAEG